jgi:hypothetical protein
MKMIPFADTQQKLFRYARDPNEGQQLDLGTNASPGVDSTNWLVKKRESGRT